MVITEFQTGNFTLTDGTVLNLIRGQSAALYLDLLRVLLGDGTEGDSLQRESVHIHVLHAKVENDGKLFHLGCIYNKAEPHPCIEVSNDGKRDDKALAEKYLDHLGNCAGLGKNVFDCSWLVGVRETVGESKRYERAFARFVAEAKTATARGDDRPLFVYDLAEHLDAAVDVCALLEELAVLGRQVFAAVPSGFQVKEIKNVFAYETPPSHENCCNLCGKRLDYWDLQENVSVDRFIGYGSKYDLYRLQFKLCCECFDKILDKVAPTCKINPLLGPR